ncbi:DUF4190 domain-containing protein [Streptomyces sp. NPDC050636]|uniref:DUF4190 domain-containing protein n=1 Tax=Streptomyces sp. NPDC050636 TaxID=3154510 RepID=UPI00344AB5EE
MVDGRQQSEPSDPWAPPEDRVPLTKSSTPKVGGQGHGHAGYGGSGYGGPGYGVPGYGPQASYAQQPHVHHSGYPHSPAFLNYPSQPNQPSHPNFPNAMGYPAWQPARPDNGFGTAALAVGIVGALLGVTIFFGVLFGALAVILGAIGRAKVTRREATNGPTALAGVILGGVALLISALMIILIATHGHRSGDDGPGSGGGHDSGYSDTYDAAPPAVGTRSAPPAPGTRPAQV